MDATFVERNSGLTITITPEKRKTKKEIIDTHVSVIIAEMRQTINIRGPKETLKELIRELPYIVAHEWFSSSNMNVTVEDEDVDDLTDYCDNSHLESELV